MAGIVLWARKGDRETADAQAFLRANGYRADSVRDLDAEPPRGAEWELLRKGLGGELWPLVDARHPRYGELLPRGAEDVDEPALQVLLESQPGLVRSPVLLT
ncbi:MAG TPA: hypothetical protein VI796_01355, partial [Candidatus Thermoplasmatota archaeon]|nr:hypothetical protein [Candidatus Thermoplasmatota archaeon]